MNLVDQHKENALKTLRGFQSAGVVPQNYSGLLPIFESNLWLMQFFEDELIGIVTVSGDRYMDLIQMLMKTQRMKSDGRRISPSPSGRKIGRKPRRKPNTQS